MHTKLLTTQIETAVLLPFLGTFWKCPLIEVSLFSFHCTALLSNRTLVTLELGTNELSDVTAQKLGVALRVNPKLEGLSLWQNDITAEVSMLCFTYCNIHNRYLLTAFSFVHISMVIHFSHFPCNYGNICIRIF